MSVNIEDVTISTMEVTLAAIRVGRKQMTISIFRQIPEIDFLDEDGSLKRGLNVWGIVRHEIKDKGDLWVVAEFNGELIKGDIGNDVSLEKYKKDIDSLNAYMEGYRYARPYGYNIENKEEAKRTIIDLKKYLPIALEINRTKSALRKSRQLFIAA